MFNFNKKSVYLGNSMKDFNEVRDILDHHNIKYKYKLSDRNTSSFFPGRGVARTMYGTTPQSLNQGTTYEILVQEDEYALVQEYLKKEL